jgi:hypothetical protein
MPRACPVEYYVCRYSNSEGRLIDATGLSRGDSRYQLDSDKRETPRDKPVASWILVPGACIAASVRLHGTSPWHLGSWSQEPV